MQDKGGNYPAHPHLASSWSRDAMTSTFPTASRPLLGFHGTAIVSQVVVGAAVAPTTASTFASSSASFPGSNRLFPRVFASQAISTADGQGRSLTAWASPASPPLGSSRRGGDDDVGTAATATTAEASPHGGGGGGLSWKYSVPISVGSGSSSTGRQRQAGGGGGPAGTSHAHAAAREGSPGSSMGRPYLPLAATGVMATKPLPAKHSPVLRSSLVTAGVGDSRQHQGRTGPAVGRSLDAAVQAVQADIERPVVKLKPIKVCLWGVPSLNEVPAGSCLAALA